MLVPKINQILLEHKMNGNRISKQSLADELGISRQMLSNYISGTSYPPADKLFRLAALLDRKVDDLYDLKS